MTETGTPASTEQRTHIPVVRGTATASDAERELAGQLAKWIEAEGIADGDVAAAAAGSLVLAGGVNWITRHFTGGTGSVILRGIADSFAGDARMTLEEWVAENYWHGHLAEDMRL